MRYSLGKKNNSVEGGFVPAATGFLYAWETPDRPDHALAFVVTNRHVADAAPEVTHIRINQINGDARLVSITEATREGVKWTRHETADVAVLQPHQNLPSRGRAEPTTCSSRSNSSPPMHNGGR